jgi:cell division protein FtsL
LQTVQGEIADLDKKITDQVTRLDERIDGAIARITDLETWKSGIESLENLC